MIIQIKKTFNENSLSTSMTDIWDFSNLIESWSQPTDTTPVENEEILQEKQKQLEEIQKQLSILDSKDSSAISELHLLSCPINLPQPIQEDKSVTTSKNIPETNETENSEKNETGEATEPSPENDTQDKPPSEESTQKIPVQPTSGRSGISNNTVSKTSAAATPAKTTGRARILPPQNTKKQSAPKIIRPKWTNQTKSKTITQARSIEKQGPIFVANPDQIRVVNFSLLGPTNTSHSNSANNSSKPPAYIRTFTLQNISSHTHGFQIRGPKDPAFHYRILEDIENSLIRPGLHLTFEVTFTPTEPRDYEDSIMIVPGPEEVPTIISINCYRDPPILELDDVVSLGSTLVFSKKSGSFQITNRGGIAFFSFSSTTGREDSLVYTDGPFSLVPAQFQLDRDQSIEIQINFKPVEEGKHSRSFDILPADFPQKFSFLTQGEAATPSLHFEITEDDRLFLPFLPENSNSTRSITIVNGAEVSHSYHVQIVRTRDSTR